VGRVPGTHRLLGFSKTLVGLRDSSSTSAASRSTPGAEHYFQLFAGLLQALGSLVFNSFDSRNSFNVDVMR